MTSKIKVIKDETELEGTIDKGFVKPFGTSGHLIVEKQHLGKELMVVYPTKPQYCWLLSDQSKRKLISTARSIIHQRDGRLEPHYLEYLEDLTKTSFKLHSLIKIVQILEEADVEKELIKEIKKIYSI